MPKQYIGTAKNKSPLNRIKMALNQNLEITGINANFANMETWDNDRKAEAINLVLERICDGESLRSILRNPNQDGLPAVSTFLGWVKEDESIQKQYARACDLRADSKFESIEQDYMEAPQRDPETGKIDPAWVQLQRLKIDAKKWELSKMMPKKYGDKIDIDHTSGGEKIEPTRIVFGKPSED